MRTSVIALLRRGSSSSSSLYSFPGNYVTVRAASLQAHGSGPALLQAHGSGCTRASPTRSNWLSQTASFPHGKHFSTLSSNAILSPNPNILLQQEESKDENSQEKLFFYESSQPDSILRLQHIRFRKNINSVIPISALFALHISMGYFNVGCYLAALTILGCRVRASACSGWYLNNYVYRLSWQPGSDQIEVITMPSCFGSMIRTTIKLADIKPQKNLEWKFSTLHFLYATYKIRMYASSFGFVANGKTYFIEDGCNFGNKKLLALLNPESEESED